MRKSSQRLTVLLCSLFIILIILELSLRFVGSRYAYISESDSTAKQKCTKTILTVGDSVTFGIGAPRGLSYPDQLRSLLNSNSEKECYNVINRGRPGQNSSQILKMLPSWLEEFHPDIVTLLIGAQNQVNYFGYQDYLKGRNTISPNQIKLHSYLDNIKVYKFARFLLIDLLKKSRKSKPDDDFTDQPEPAFPGGKNLQTGLYDSDSRSEAYRRECSIGEKLREQGKWEESHEQLLEHAARGPLSAVCYNMIGSVYREKNQPEKGIPWFEKGIRQDPSYYENYEEIGGILYEKGKLEKALEWFQRGLTNADPLTLHNQSYIHIGRLFRQTGKLTEAEQFFIREKERVANKNPELSAVLEDYLLIFSKKQKTDTIHEWIISDLEKMVALCRQHGTIPILQNYPFEPEVNHLFRRLAEQEDIPFVDQQQIFMPYTVNGVRNPDVFVPDGHPNTKGYKMMAENIFRLLQRKKMVY